MEVITFSPPYSVFDLDLDLDERLRRIMRLKFLSVKVPLFTRLDAVFKDCICFAVKKFLSVCLLLGDLCNVGIFCDLPSFFFLFLKMHACIK